MTRFYAIQMNGPPEGPDIRAERKGYNVRN